MPSVSWDRLPLMDAYQVVSQAARAPVTERVDLEYTVLVKVEKKRLPIRK